MSINIDSNLRLELGRQRQAELLQRAHQNEHERALAALALAPTNTAALIAATSNVFVRITTEPSPDRVNARTGVPNYSSNVASPSQ